MNNDTAFITAWSNDDSFDNVFTRQMQALQKKMIFYALSTSGNSKNLLTLSKYAANNNGISIISLTGNDGGELKQSI